jgi:hypothetical protein
VPFYASTESLRNPCDGKRATDPPCSFAALATVLPSIDTNERVRTVKAVSQLLWPDKDREVWFSLGENHEEGCGFALHQLRNCPSAH